jgi:LEA14-like dessication related protein
MRTRTMMMAAAVMLTVAGGCKSLGSSSFLQPEVSVKSVTVNGVGLTGGSVEINLNVYNPNRVALDASRLTYQLWVDTLRFGQGSMDKGFHIGSKDTAVVRVPLEFSWSTLGSVGRELLNRGTVPYRVNGDITVASGIGNHTIKYDQTGRFSPLGGSR